MRSGLNGRRINRLAVNATYREIIHGESTATLTVDYQLDDVAKAGILPGPIAMTVSDETAGSGTVSPGSEGLAMIELQALADPGVYGGGDSAGMAEIEPSLVSEPTVLPVSEFPPSLAVIAFETRVSPLAIPYIPATYAHTPAARLMDIGDRETLSVPGGRRDMNVENTRDQALEVEDDERGIEITDSQREIEVRHKRRLEP